MKTLKEIFKQHYEWRSQILKLAKADIVKTYSGAALGWAWALIKPTITIFVFWFAFAVGLRQGSSDIAGHPYVMWMISGLVAWFYMSDMIGQGAGAIRKYKYLVTKMKFPVSTIPTFMGLSKFAVHLCIVVIVILIFGVAGFWPDRYIVQLPFYMLVMLIFFIEWSLFSSMLAAMSKDFQNLVRSFVTPIFWLSAIMWNIKSDWIPDWLQTVFLFNPVTYVSSGYRNVFIYKVWFFEEPKALLAMAFMILVMGILAVWSYKKLIKEIPDVL